MSGCLCASVCDQWQGHSCHIFLPPGHPQLTGAPAGSALPDPAAHQHTRTARTPAQCRTTAPPWLPSPWQPRTRGACWSAAASCRRACRPAGRAAARTWRTSPAPSQREAKVQPHRGAQFMQRPLQQKRNRCSRFSSTPRKSGCFCELTGGVSNLVRPPRSRRIRTNASKSFDTMNTARSRQLQWLVLASLPFRCSFSHAHGQRSRSRRCSYFTHKQQQRVPRTSRLGPGRNGSCTHQTHRKLSIKIRTRRRLERFRALSTVAVLEIDRIAG